MANGEQLHCDGQQRRCERVMTADGSSGREQAGEALANDSPTPALTVAAPGCPAAVAWRRGRRGADRPGNGPGTAARAYRPALHLRCGVYARGPGGVGRLGIRTGGSDHLGKRRCLPRGPCRYRRQPVTEQRPGRCAVGGFRSHRTVGQRAGGLARGVSPAEVLAAVADEVANALHVYNAALFRYEDDGSAVLVAAHDEAGLKKDAGWRAADA